MILYFIGDNNMTNNKLFNEIQELKNKKGISKSMISILNQLVMEIDDCEIKIQILQKDYPKSHIKVKDDLYNKSFYIPDDQQVVFEQPANNNNIERDISVQLVNIDKNKKIINIRGDNSLKIIPVCSNSIYVEVE
jgi:hypothetical protein